MYSPAVLARIALVALLAAAVGVALQGQVPAASPGLLPGIAEEGPTVTERYSTAWQRFFGSPPPLPEAFSAPPGLSDEQTFQILWSFCLTSLQAPERDAAWGALRSKVLDDPAPALSGLHELALRGGFSLADWNGPLFYRFLDETVSDPAFLPEVLPASPSTSRLRAALMARDIGFSELRERFDAWLLVKALETGVLLPLDLKPPFVWALDQGLAPWSFSAIRLEVDPIWAGLVGEVAGDAAGEIRLLSVVVGPDGHVASASLAPLSSGKMAFAAEGSHLWLFLLNPGAERASLAGLTFTIWVSYAPMFDVEQAHLDDKGCTLVLREEDWMAAYTLWAAASAEAPRRAFAGFIPSEGAGVHRYRIPLEGLPLRDQPLRLVGRANTGSELSVEFLPSFERAVPENAP